MKLLICIAAHYSSERIQYLEKVLENFKTYQCEYMDVIIDTNSEEFPLNQSSYYRYVHNDLQHPFHLTQMHREHFKYEIDNYDWFIYIEDDIVVSWEAFLEYTKKFPILWPEYVPSFIRIEKRNNEQFVSDVIERYKIGEIIEREGKSFIGFPFPQHYHAFWIMPQKELKENINSEFTKLHDGRELAASFPMWTLQKKGLVEIENIEGKWQIKENCYSYHLPNNYIDSEMPNAKIKVKEIFI